MTELDQLADLLRDAERALVFTGAGISTASGIPDFRGPDGVWQKRKPVYYQQFMSSASKRRVYWMYKADEMETLATAEPNAGHRDIADLEQAGKVEMVVTQNIDGLHSMAGTTAERLVELHGTNREVECQTCEERTAPERHFERFERTDEAPDCHCGGFLKPATISFGQNLREIDMKRAYEAADRCDLVLALGSTLSVNPAASVPLIATLRGIPYVIINRGETAHDRLTAVTLRIEGDVGELFPAAVERALGEGTG